MPDPVIELLSICIFVEDERAEDVNQTEVLSFVDLDVLEPIEFSRKHEVNFSAQ